DGRRITRDDLRGKFWVAHFFYCTCEKGCAETTATMARLQHAFAERTDLVFVSIHVNPEDEDADLLRQYADAKGADPKRWWFLRGDPKTLRETLEKSFKVGLTRADKEPIGVRVSHSLRLFLVNPDGEIIGSIANGTDSAQVTQLEERISEAL